MYAIFYLFSFKLEAKHTQQNLAVNKFEYKSTGSDCTENREAVKGAGKWETERVALFSSFEEMGEPACLVRSFSHPSSECSNEPNEVTSGLLFAYFTFLAFLFSFQFVRSSYIVKIFHGSLSHSFFCSFVIFAGLFVWILVGKIRTLKWLVHFILGSKFPQFSSAVHGCPLIR